MNIKYEDLSLLNKRFKEEYKTKIDQIFERGHLILGPEVEEFEDNFAKYNNSKYCIGVASGLDALILSILALDIPKGSEIIVPANSYIASIVAILKADCVPVLVEPNLETYNLDTILIEKHITKRTKAILSVHMYGKISNMEEIMQIAKAHNLFVIEDAAQAHGAMQNSKKAGTFGNLGCFSFYPTKNLGAIGDGGAIVTDSQDLASKLRSLRNYGFSKIRYVCDTLGYNSRLDEVQAAFLNIKLKYLDEINSHKNKLAKIYHENIPSHFVKPKIQNGYYDVYHIYNIRTKKRDELKKYLEDNNIQTIIHYPIPPHRQKALANLNLDVNNFLITDEIHDTTLSLPISWIHNEKEVECVCKKLNYVIN